MKAMRTGKVTLRSHRPCAVYCTNGGSRRMKVSTVSPPEGHSRSSTVSFSSAPALKPFQLENCISMHSVSSSERYGFSPACFKSHFQSVLQRSSSTRLATEWCLCFSKHAGRPAKQCTCFASVTGMSSTIHKEERGGVLPGVH